MQDEHNVWRDDMSTVLWKEVPTELRMVRNDWLNTHGAETHGIPWVDAVIKAQYRGRCTAAVRPPHRQKYHPCAMSPGKHKNLCHMHRPHSYWERMKKLGDLFTRGLAP